MIFIYYIGVDLGGTNIAVGLLDENFKIIAKEKCPTKTERDISEIMDDMGKLCNTLIEKNKLTPNDIAYIGIATPGSVLPPQGMVAYSNNVKMRNYPISAELTARTGVEKVYVENDANSAALGEAIMGAGKGSDNVIMITLGTGVGGGIVINRKLYSGFNFAGGELGHIVIQVNGRPCGCGRLGCWEAYSSATGLINMTREKLAECEEKGIKTSIPVTDDAMVVEYFLNKKVHLVYGSYENIKITTPEDLGIAESFLKK